MAMTPYDIVAGQMDLINRSMRNPQGRTAEEARDVYDLITGLERATPAQLDEVFGELSPRTLARLQQQLDTVRDVPTYENSNQD